MRRSSPCANGSDQVEITGADIVGAGEGGGAADGPGDRGGVEREGAGDLVDDLERVARLAVHLVDEGEDRDVAEAADLEQFAGACLDAFGGVDHHDGGVDRGEGAVGVFGEVFVARRVQQVEDAAAIFERHDRGDDGDAAVALDAHPVGPGTAAFTLGADVACELDGAARPEQALGQRGLAGIRVGDDREGATAVDFLGGGHGFAPSKKKPSPAGGRGLGEGGSPGMSGGSCEPSSPRPSPASGRGR